MTEHMGMKMALNPEQQTAQTQRIAPVLTHLNDGEILNGLTMWKEIQEDLEKGLFVVVCFIGEPASGKGHLLRETLALVIKYFPHLPKENITITTLAGEATKMEEAELAPAKWEEWQEQDFESASEGMAQHVRDAYEAYPTNVGGNIVLAEFLGILPINAGNSVLDEAKRLAAMDERVCLYIIASGTDDDVWFNEHARRQEVESAQTPEELSRIDQQHGVRRVSLAGRLLKTAPDPRVIEKESGNSAAIERVRGMIDSTLIEEYAIIKASAQAIIGVGYELPEEISLNDLSNPNYPKLRQVLILAHIQKAIEAWNLPDSARILIAPNNQLNGRLRWYPYL